MFDSTRCFRMPFPYPKKNAKNLGALWDLFGKYEMWLQFNSFLYRCHSFDVV